MEELKIEEIKSLLISSYSELYEDKNWGEEGIFYNPGKKLPLGAYMVTFKEKDGSNDFSSNISKRKGIYRLNLKVSRETFIEMFGEVPKRPAKGGVVNTGHDFTQCDVIMPHPVYGWMTWICVLNPSEETFLKMQKRGLFDEAYSSAVKTFNKKVR